MEFYLKYDGPSKSNAGAKDKHKIRECLYPQMKKLWDIEPLKSCKEVFLTSGRELSVLQEVDGVIFCTLGVQRTEIYLSTRYNNIMA